MKASRRRLVLGVGPALGMVAIVTPVLLYWSRLPDPVATHWGLTGSPDGSMPAIALLAVVAGIYAAMWWAVARAVRRSPTDAGSYTAGLWFVGGLLSAVQWLIVAANENAAAWHDAGGTGWIRPIAAVAGSLILGVAGWKAAGGRPGSSPSRLGPVLPIDDASRIVWSGRAGGPVLQVAGIVVAAAGLLSWGWITPVLIAVGFLVLTFGSVRVTIGTRGALVALGWLGVPSWSVPISTITGAHVDRVAAMAYGGWGYRIRPGVRALIVRGGEAIRFERAGKPDLAVTVDDAATGAGLINSLLRTAEPR